MLTTIIFVVLYTVMATLQKQNGKYWCIVQSVRVNGKPRPKILAYLGTAEDLLDKLSGKIPVSSKSYEYGTVAVVYNFLQKLNIAEMFDRICFKDAVIPKHNGLTVGQTMAMIILQRAINPSSKRAFSNWSKQTFLPQMCNFASEDITSQHFWDMMDYVNIKKISTIEEDVTKLVIEKFQIEFSTLLYDYTNFYTFIDTNNSDCTIAKRGKNKQKRDNLKQFSLALLVSRYFKIPLFSDIYEGNKSDSKEFANTIDKIKERLNYLSNSLDTLTIIFDKGSNSKANFKKIGELNFVGSLSLSHDSELKEIPYSKFSKLIYGTEEILCYRSKKDIWGKEKTVVMYKSVSLYNGQLKGLEKDLIDVKKDLKKLKQSSKEGFYFGKNKSKKKWTRELLERDVVSKINKQFVRDVVDFQIKDLEGDKFDLIFSISKPKIKKLKNTVLGKRILITTRHDWSDEEIINAYRGQSDVEQSFRQIKNPFHNCVRPQYHWTDQKIIVHTFCSILSFTISSLIEKTASDNGYNMTINEIYEKLKEIRKVKYVCKGKKKNE